MHRAAGLPKGRAQRMGSVKAEYLGEVVWMFKRLRFAFWLTGLLLVVGLGALGQEEKASPIGDITYLKYTYQMELGAEGLSETTTTVMTRMTDGRYEVVTTTQSISSPGEVHLRFGGASLQWLGLYAGGASTGRLDISQLNAFSDVVLEPHHTYTLPDGGLLQMGDTVTVAGIAGVEGVYTNRSVAGATITVVMATDLQVRALLPFPLRVSVEYAKTASDVTTSYSGTIVLVDYTTTVPQ